MLSNDRAECQVSLEKPETSGWAKKHLGWAEKHLSPEASPWDTSVSGDLIGAYRVVGRDLVQASRPSRLIYLVDRIPKFLFQVGHSGVCIWKRRVGDASERERAGEQNSKCASMRVRKIETSMWARQEVHVRRCWWGLEMGKSTGTTSVFCVDIYYVLISNGIYLQEYCNNSTLDSRLKVTWKLLYILYIL